jgi:hypothetical protein
MERGSYFLFLQEQIKDIIIIISTWRTPGCFRRYAVYGTGVTVSGYTVFKLICSGDGVRQRGFGWRIHCGVEVTESSTNKELSPAKTPPGPAIRFLKGPSKKKEEAY